MIRDFESFIGSGSSGSNTAKLPFSRLLGILYFVWSHAFLILLLFLIVLSPIHFFPTVQSGDQVHMQVHILFSHMIRLHHEWLDGVPRATQQDLIAWLHGFFTFVWIWDNMAHWFIRILCNHIYRLLGHSEQ